MKRLTRFFECLAPWSVVVLTFAVAACDTLDDLVSVEAPSQVAAQNLDDPANAELLVASAANDFQCALAHYVAASAFIGTELMAASNLLGGSFVFYDQRVFTPGGYAAMYATGDCAGDAPNVYEPLSTARWMADETLRRLDEWGDAEVPNRTALVAETAAFAGYSYTLIGEGMCQAAFDLGPAMSPPEIFARAEERFTRAIDAAETANADDFLNLALVGRARVRLNLGDLDDAAADAVRVPDGFVFEAEYSSVASSTENRVHTLNHRDLMASVEPAYRDMTFEGEPDPRVQVTDLGIDGPGSTIPMWVADKYSTIDSPIPIATWEEAQLIMAEAAVAAGRLQDAVGIINTLHARVGLPDFSSGDAGEIMDQIVYERRAELFLEGHHLQDIKRYGLTLDPAPGEPFVFGGSYGDQTCFPLPEVESLNNPEIG